MWPVIIKEGIVILVAGAMLVMGSLNITTNGSPKQQINEIVNHYEKHQKEYIDWAKKHDEDLLKDKEAVIFNNIDSFVEENDFSNISEKTIQEILNKTTIIAPTTRERISKRLEQESAKKFIIQGFLEQKYLVKSHN